LVARHAFEYEDENDVVATWPRCVICGRTKAFIPVAGSSEPPQIVGPAMVDPNEVTILRRLREAAITVGALSKKTGLSVTQIENVLESLGRSGFAFKRTSGEICVLSEPKSLVPQSIMARLQTKIIGRDVLVFHETSSTNDLARQAGAGGAAEGIVFFAQRQRAGRGTRGRKWISDSDQGLWFSILLRSRLSLDRCPLLIQMAALAAVETAERWSEQPVLVKPPNDLYLGGGKLGGFLLETSNGWDFQVLGIGINVRSAPEIDGYPTAALDQFIKSPISLAELAADFLNRFENWYLKTPLDAVERTFAARLS
jgi:BirA family transcriptional regulator, biotin operon repressor / biotin---[acetyl-CoA-carboxylase] ligase